MGNTTVIRGRLTDEWARSVDGISNVRSQLEEREKALLELVTGFLKAHAGEFIPTAVIAKLPESRHCSALLRQMPAPFGHILFFENDASFYHTTGQTDETAVTKIKFPIVEPLTEEDVRFLLHNRDFINAL